ncbi:hypothetical protein RRG08_036577 [Elysia crispata]|uniref:Uncharacterized protein n=1 Tax=Elysia crispata TaxID=231223 RepID=A0AAE0ZR92_9GAST|nr:hypothetical protein RRG08_036577 [Elysia crispata]
MATLESQPLPLHPALSPCVVVEWREPPELSPIIGVASNWGHKDLHTDIFRRALRASSVPSSSFCSTIFEQVLVFSRGCIAMIGNMLLCDPTKAMISLPRVLLLVWTLSRDLLSAPDKQIMTTNTDNGEGDQ